MNSSGSLLKPTSLTRLRQMTWEYDWKQKMVQAEAKAEQAEDNGQTLQLLFDKS